jgi:hypothetical protein
MGIGKGEGREEGRGNTTGERGKGRECRGSRRDRRRGRGVE